MILEVFIVRIIHYYFNLIKDVYEIEPSFCIFFRLLNIKYFRIFNKSTKLSLGDHVIKKNDLILQEIIFENDNNIGENLKPIFDIIYNSAGIDGSYFYDQDGRWIGEREWDNGSYM